MKKTLSMITLAVLTVGLLGSCSKINERLDNLEKKVDGLENEKIASIESQITGINSSISDLGTIRSNIQSLTNDAKAQGEDIADLQAADKSLGERIDDLNKYVNDTLKGTTDWVNGTFSTLEQYEKTCDTIAKIDARIGALDANLSKKIDDCAASIKEWVNELFEGYYTTAQMDAKISALQRQIDTTRGISDERADSIVVDLTATKVSIDTAKAAIRAEYKAAVQQAIEDNEGFVTATIKHAIDSVHGRVDSLTAKVDAIEADVNGIKEDIEGLKAMIQSIELLPDYGNGNIEVNYFGDINQTTIFRDLVVNYKISPASAVDSIFAAKPMAIVNFFNLYFKGVKLQTRAQGDATHLAIRSVTRNAADNSVITVTVDSKELDRLPVRNCISDHTTLSVALGVKVGKSDIVSKYADVTFVSMDDVDIENVYIQMARLIGSRQPGKDYNPYRVLFNMCGDDVIAAGRWPGDHDEIAALNQFRYDASNEVIYYCYTNFYKAIDVCNQFICRYFDPSKDYELYNADGLPEEYANKLMTYLAEVRTLRAWLHFTLACGWNNPPLVTTYPANPWPTNCDNKDLLKWCTNELAECINSTRLTYKEGVNSTEAICVVSSDFAKALAGKVYLFLGDNAQAAKYLEDVINSGRYALVTTDDFYKNFHSNGNRSEEKVFELDMEKYAGPGYVDASQIPYMGMETSLWNWYSDGFIADPMPSTPSVKGQGCLGIPEEFVKFFDPGDLRAAATFKNIGDIITDDNGGIKKNGLFGQSFYLPVRQLVYNSDLNAGTGNNKTNFTVMRFAEVLLLASEACNTDDKKLQYLNMVHTRAGLPAYPALNPDYIKLEMELELWMEGCRWTDIMRWKDGKAFDRLTNAGKTYTVLYDKKSREPRSTESPNWLSGRFYTLTYDNPKAASCGFKKGKHEWFPYPQAVIRSNKYLQQNPGW